MVARKSEVQDGQEWTLDQGWASRGPRTGPRPLDLKIKVQRTVKKKNNEKILLRNEAGRMQVVGSRNE